MPLAPHGQGNIGAHAVASIPEGLTVETYPGLRGRQNEIIPLFEIEAGKIVLPQELGLGLTVNEDILTTHRT